MIEHDELLKKQAYIEMEKQKDTVTQDPFRLNYHIMPPVGLLNDPNGFVYFNGYYHLFYQWNPFATTHGAKFWGHYMSKDLVNWEACPIALAPSDWFDKNGCYSGSAVVEEGKLVLFYTGNVKDEFGNRETYQCKAVSEDGIHFDKKGPVVYQPEGYTAHFRDPKVFKKEKFWYMVIGAQTLDEAGCILLYCSEDLSNWLLLGPIAGSHLNGLNRFGYMWECPDLLKLEKQDILIVSPQGLEPEGINYHNIYQAGYFSGKINFDVLSYQHSEFTELDRGFDFYAPQTTKDKTGRTLLFGWMGVPEENEAFHPTIANNWIHAMTLPRELTWKNEKLYQNPVEELKKLRQEKILYSDVQLDDSEVQFDGTNGAATEIQLDINQNEAKTIEFYLGGATKLSYHKDTCLVTLERRGIQDSEILEKRQCKMEHLTQIRIFQDTSSIEIFINEGEAVFTARLFDWNDDNLVLNATGKLSVDLIKWDLAKVMN